MNYWKFSYRVSSHHCWITDKVHLVRTVMDCLPAVLQQAITSFHIHMCEVLLFCWYSCWNSSVYWHWCSRTSMLVHYCSNKFFAVSWDSQNLQIWLNTTNSCFLCHETYQIWPLHPLSTKQQHKTIKYSVKIYHKQLCLYLAVQYLIYKI